MGLIQEGTERVTVDINKLSEAELIDLNHRIVERLRMIQQMRTHGAMLQFSIGERVTFTPDGQPAVVGVLVKYNRKSVSVVTEDGRRWTVSPGLLSKIKDAPSQHSRVVVDMPRLPGE